MKILGLNAFHGDASAAVLRDGYLVAALEDDAARARRCADILAQLGAANVTTVVGPLDAGWPALAPFDVILVNGTFEVEPEGLFRQLKEGGRLVGVVSLGDLAKKMDEGRALADISSAPPNR